MRASNMLAGAAAAAAVAIAGAVAGAGAGAASAATVSELPPLPAGQQRNDGNLVVLSPYGPDGVTCYSFHAQISNCWQQRPDGQWEPLAGYGPVSVYPVWDDPASLQGVLPDLPPLPDIPGSSL